MMRQVVSVGVACLVLLLLSANVLAEMHSFSLTREANLNGTTLMPGRYRIKVNGNLMAEVYSGKKLLLKTAVQLVPLNGLTPSSVNVSSEGQLVEVRLKKRIIRF